LEVLLEAFILIGGSNFLSESHYQYLITEIFLPVLGVSGGFNDAAVLISGRLIKHSRLQLLLRFCTVYLSFNRYPEIQGKKLL
jgi:hypothetical protein